MADEQLGLRFRGKRGHRGHRGKRGHRGHRGERGHRGHHGDDGTDGATGATGAAGTSGGGLLKFSGVVTATVEGGLDFFLADAGVGVGVDALTIAPSYPTAINRSLVNFATNVQLIVPILGQVIFKVLLNGIPIPGFSITYNGLETGVKSVLAGPVTLAGAPIGDRVDVSVQANGFDLAEVDVSATIGVQ